ncbi:hypothetical protein ACWC9R_11780 [Streptomyces sp. NPDC001219]
MGLTLVLTGCGDSELEKRRDTSRSPSAVEKTRFRLGEASPPQESAEYADAKFTVTPTKVLTGTKKDVARSGLEKDQGGLPVYVWSTVTQKTGKAMEVGAIEGELIVKTNMEERTRSLFVLMGDATWPNCPTTDLTKKLIPGQPAKICTAFLITEGQKAAAVEFSRGYGTAPLEWPVKD